MEKGDWDILMPRQIPWPDCHEIDRERICKWTPRDKRIYSMPHADHVGSLYRTEQLLQWSLPNAPIAEDVLNAQNTTAGVTRFMGPWKMTYASADAKRAYDFAQTYPQTL